jgi:hypothetical protein
MKKLYLLTLLVISFFSSFAQYENSWINYGQPYYKIKIAQEGIYRLYYTQFLSNAIPVVSNQASKIQLFHNGEEQYIYVYDGGNGIIDNTNEYIEFYAAKNDGSFDKEMYEDSTWQVNGRFSLINDTAVYFLSFLNQSSSFNGKRLTNVVDTTNYSSYTPSQYFLKETYYQENNEYNLGNYSDNADYTNAEGWVGTSISNIGSYNSQALTLNTANVYTGSSAPPTQVKTAVAGSNNNPHHFRINAPSYSSYIYTDESSLAGYVVGRYSYSVPNYNSQSLYIIYSIVNQPNITDRVAFSNISIVYPHTLDLEGASTFPMYVPDGNNGNAYLPFTNFSSSPAILYDVTNHRRIAISQTGSNLKALVPNDGSSQLKYCYLTSAPQNIIKTYPTDYNGSYGFTNFNLQSPQYAVDSAYIIITHKSLLSTINQSNVGYKAYRDGTTQNRVRVIDVDELYDQFAYGIKHHGLGIKKFVNYILDTWTVARPQAIFLVGKSIEARLFRSNPTIMAKCLVASYGYPTTDNLLVSGISGSQWEPVVPIGRISAEDAGEVNLYLDKVKEYEAAQNAPYPEAWMKEVLHFGGGDNISQQITIRYYLDELKAIIQDSAYGGHVTSYFKTSPDPISINQSDSLQAKIDSGVSFMQFFGHASGSTFDIATDEPSNYDNRGKYPIVSASSCFAGNVHVDDKSVGERFVLQPAKAAIAFLASVGLGYEYYLYRFDTTLYQNIAYLNYGKSLGKIVQETNRQIQAADPSDIRIKQVMNEMSIQGDPALKFNSWPKPDFVADERNVTFFPTNVSSDLESFTMKFATRNYAKAVADSFNVVITRTFPDGIDSVYTIPRAKCYYADTLEVIIPIGGNRGAGVNNFKIRVDLDPDQVDEIQNLGNNETTASLFIISNDISPIYPVKFAIHPNPTVTLKASTMNPFRPVRPYRFEIDTVYFNDNSSSHSPMYRTAVISSSGGVVSWTPNLTLDSNRVYYWRVYDDTATVLKNESSFIYIPQKTGWSQAHFYQFKNNTYKYVEQDSLARQFKFTTNQSLLQVRNYGWGGSSVYYLNNSIGEVGGGCTYNGHPNSGPAVMVAIIDSLTLQPINNLNVNHGQLNLHYDFPYPYYTVCRGRPENYFVYPMSDPNSLTNLHSWIRDTLPDGYFVLIYSWTTWNWTLNNNTALDSVMTELGCTQWPPEDSVPFAFVVKKGDPGVLNVFTEGTNFNDSAFINANLVGQWYKGNMISSIIGPATKWTMFHWEEHPIETGSTHDIASVNIFGLNNSTDVWDTLIKLADYQLDSSLLGINPQTYSYLKLEEFVQDDSLRTPPQTDRWQVYYDEAPESALNPARQFSFYNNPIAEGDTIKMSVAIDNIGNLPMDSLEVSWFLYDRNRIRHNLLTTKLDSLRIGQWLSANIKVDTTFSLYGSNSIWVEVNPYTLNHQIEQYHFNNLAEVKFNMTRDVTNPLLDVAFDGVHILDGDIVSGKPQITIQLKDENKFLSLNDTANFRVYLKSPNSNTLERVYFSQVSYSDSLHFKAAQLPDNRAQIIYNPILSEDGVYTLEVEAADMSNNESGKFNYRITFEVINKSTITEVLNYPNPFTTSTRFVFVLTGNEVPDRMRIRIMTVSGKVIREIMNEELGNIHIGRNITDYAWDGKDEYGDQLANGVYIYKVVTDFSEGKEIEHRASEADKYFTKGWGKMYLMR